MAKNDGLPKCMYQKHGAYYLVRKNQWVRLSDNLHDALVEYARLTSGPDGSALAELVTNVLKDLESEKLADSSMRMYRSHAKRFLDAFVEFRPDQIRPYHIAKYLDSMKSTAGAANISLAWIRNVFKRAVRWGVVEADPSRDIERFKAQARDRYITKAEYAAIHKEAGPALQCLMDIAYLTGQRIGDCLNIRYSDISDDGILFHQQKTKAKVLVSMTPDLRDSVQKAKSLHSNVKGLTLFHKRNGSPITYSMMYQQWKKACAAAEVGNANFHDIRAAAGTDAKAEGRDSKTLLGHATDTAHKRYLRSKETPIATPNKARKAV